MASDKHLSILLQGTEAWNQWRKHNPEVQPDLTGADLSRADFGGLDLHAANLLGTNLRESYLGGANLSRADLTGANLSLADLDKADLTEANLSGASLPEANLHRVNLMRADLTVSDLSRAFLGDALLRETVFTKADLSAADLSGADLTKANLMIANLYQTRLDGANLTNAFVYGASAWDVSLEDADQRDLVINAPGGSLIQVDSFDVAQFIYFLLNNIRIRQLIEVIRLKAVLILGRYTSERKSIFDTIRDELRRRAYLPILIDLDKPASRDMTETIATLAYMASFMIVDVTNTESLPEELRVITTTNTRIPIVPIELGSASQQPYAMFEALPSPTLLPLSSYENQEHLVSSFDEKILRPAEEKLRQFQV